ncbi:MAG: NADH-quinone oxidoreductase subunit NuoG, partial [Bdellovibrionales bacterium]
APKLAASCAMPCGEGMVVYTDTEKVKEGRRASMEMLLLNHPLDCPVCDQGGECDLQDFAVAYGRSHCRSKEPRRQVQDKELGPLIKTVMTRCIHCTRCVRFMEEIAGSLELGGFFRGENLEIAPVYNSPLLSELSGNLVDVCPVGALTSKPYAFRARAWELKKTPSIDVMDAVGSNIYVESREDEVMRIMPREHKDINDIWINDKTRFACDGLSLQRLECPYIRREGRLEPASWEEAFKLIAQQLKNIGPHRLAALVGDLADCESVFALRELMQRFDCPNIDCRMDGSVYDVSSRSSYIMNSTIAGIDKADAILLVGTDPRHEASMINARIYKRWRAGGCKIGLIGQAVDLSYPYLHLGHSSVACRDLLEGTDGFADVLRRAKNPMLIVGASALAREDGPALHACLCRIVEECSIVRPYWNGFNVLQTAAARVGALDLGFVPQKNGMATKEILYAASAGALSALYLLGADEIDLEKPEGCFVIYQGHHGDKGAHIADVILPACAYTEKDATYVNCEGRPQMTEAAVAPLGMAQADWKIIQSLSQYVGYDLGFSSLENLRAHMYKAAPHLKRVNEILSSTFVPSRDKGALSLDPLPLPILNFFMTDPISRASQTMAQCSLEILPFLGKGGAS